MNKRRVGISSVRVAGVLTICAGLLLGSVWIGGDRQESKKKGLGPVETVTAVSPPTSTTGAAVTATATCPKGKKAFGGGFVDDAVLDLAALRRRVAPRLADELDRDRQLLRLQWRVPAVERHLDRALSPPVKGAGGGHHHRSGRRSVERTPATAIARCQGKKQKLISGGFHYSPPANGNTHQALVYENQPVGKDWHASVQNSGTSPARTLTGYAYCAKGLKNSPKITSGSTAFTSRPHSARSPQPAHRARARRGSRAGALSRHSRPPRH